MKSPVLARRSRWGITLFGVAICMGVLGFVLGGGLQLLRDGRDAYVRARAKSLLATRARNASQHLASLITTANPDVLLPDADARRGTSALRFRQPRTVTKGEVEWGPLMCIEREYEPEELDDGLDNDGNGLVDDGRLVLTRDPGGAAEVRIVLCHGVRELLEGEVWNGVDDNGNGRVDEPGFEIARRDRALNLRFTLESADGHGSSDVFTVERSVVFRN